MKKVIVIMAIMFSMLIMGVAGYEGLIYILELGAMSCEGVDKVIVKGKISTLEVDCRKGKK